MWNRAGARSAALERAKAQLSGLRVTTSRTLNQQNPTTDASNVSFGGLLRSRQTPLQDLSDLSSDTGSEKQIYQTGHAETVPRSAEPPVQTGMGGGNRFLKKSANNRTPSVSHTDTNDVRFIPQRSSQSVALSRLALIEDRIRNRKNNQADPGAGPELVRSSSELSAAGGSRFLKKKAFSKDEGVPEGTRGSSCVAPVRTTTCGEKRASLDSDEEDMRKLLGESPLDSLDSINILRQTETGTQAAVKPSRKSNEQTVKSAAKLEEELPISSTYSVPHVRTPSPSSKTPSPSRPFSRRAEISKRALSSASGHSEIRSLEELFPVTSDHDDTLSESSVSEDFKLNVMTLDDLAPVSPGASAILKEKTKASSSAFRNLSVSSADAISQRDSPKPDDDSAQYETDFESEIQTEMDEISERLSAGPEPQSRSPSAKSQTDNDYSLSEEASSLRSERSSKESSLSSRKYSDPTSSSSDATVTHTEPRSERRSKKDATVQTQADGLSYTWSLGQAVLGPSVGMTYVDPTPVASHIISAEAVEALSAYSPAAFALNDMLRQQLALTRSFVQVSRRLHQCTLESLGPADYKYTTLEDAKEFIRRNRPTRLTMEDALEEVLQEMRDYHYI